MFRKMLIAHDGSAGAARAFTEALPLARRLDVELHMVCVETLPRLAAPIDEVEEEQSDAAHIFNALIKASSEKAFECHVDFKAHLLAGHPVAAICNLIKRENYDLLIIGFMGHTALYNRLIGSTTDRLVELAPCKVLVVK